MSLPRAEQKGKSNGVFLVRIKFKASARIGVLVNHLRKGLDQLLEVKIAHPEAQIANHPLVEAITALISSNGQLG